MCLMNRGMRIGALAAVSILFLSGPSRPLDGSGVSPLAVIPFREMAQHMYVKARIGGLRDLSVVIDTGSPEFILSQKVFERLQLPFTGMVNIPSRVEGLRPNPAVLTSVPSVSFGAVTMKNLPAIVLRLEWVKTMLGVDTDAIIGPELFSRYVVELDYSKQVLRLYDPSKYPEPQNGCKLPLQLRAHPLVHAAIITKTGKSVDAVLLLDTGTEYSVFTKPFVASHPDVLANYLPAKPQEGLGTGGIVRGRLGRAFGIRLGGCTIAGPTVVFSQNATGMYPGAGPFSGEIGLNIFREFTTIFNYPRGYVVFQGKGASSGSGPAKHL